MEINNSENIVISYVVFTLNGEYFALSTEYVTEVIENSKITNVPKSPKHILGVTNFRGDILPVISGNIKFQFTEHEKKQTNYLIMVIEFEYDGRKSRIGMLVDSVNDVQKSSITEVLEVPVSDSKFNPDFLEGAFKRENKYVYILNAKKVFAQKEVNLLN